jgi:hypothetical protein
LFSSTEREILTTRADASMKNSETDLTGAFQAAHFALDKIFD